jgi:hypothetical protein
MARQPFLLLAAAFLLMLPLLVGGCDDPYFDQDVEEEPDALDPAGDDSAQDLPVDAPDSDPVGGCTVTGCSDHGRCDELTGLCLCEVGYVGTLCENCAPGYDLDPVSNNCVMSTMSCADPGACSHHGTCHDGSGSTWCECYQDRYVGDRCSECAADYDWFYGVCGLKDQASASPDRAYEWYKTQMGTGPFETNNCGPTSAAMAMVWYERTLDVDPGVVREAITGTMDGWWYTSHIEQALDLYGVPYAIMEVTSADDARAELDAGHILILCLTMDMISQQVPPYETHFNRFYGYGSGHFLVVKGYMENGSWLDFYDPNNWSADHYTDGSPYGKDRFYSSSEVVASARTWWPYMFVIGASRSKGLNSADIPVGRSGP